MEIEEKAYWLALLSDANVDRNVAKQALYRWTIVQQQLLSACARLSAQTLMEQLPELDALQAERWEAAFSRASQAQVTLEHWRSQGADLLTRADPRYPESLAERLPERWLPYMFLYRGDLHLLERPVVFVSGSSHASERANAAIAELSKSLASLPISQCGTYAQGIERLMLNSAAAEHAATVLILPVGLAHAGPVLRLGQEAVERGERLELSPFTPETRYSPALGNACTRLATALSDVLVLVDHVYPVADWPGLTEQVAHGGRSLWWTTAAAAIGSDWTDIGAVAVDTPTEAARLVTSQLALDMESEQGPDSDLSVEYYSPDAVHFQSADSAIARLARTGRVPEKLVRRLRDAERRGNLGDVD